MGYATRFFREFFPTVESCFWIVSGREGRCWLQYSRPPKRELAGIHSCAASS